MYITQTQRVTYLVPVNLHNKETKHEFFPKPMRIIYIHQTGTSYLLGSIPSQKENNEVSRSSWHGNDLREHAVLKKTGSKTQTCMTSLAPNVLTQVQYILPRIGDLFKSTSYNGSWRLVSRLQLPFSNWSPVPHFPSCSKSRKKTPAEMHG